ncbi:MAG TPA: KH domain-containing protein [Haliangiales bacterium]|nr:KH domain-containing protein [Haliangiales bacterium]
MTDLITFIAQALVDHPDAVQVTERQEGDTSVFELRVSPDDLGKVIGRQGRTARALRVVLQAAATKKKRRTVLEIVE